MQTQMQHMVWIGNISESFDDFIVNISVRPTLLPGQGTLEKLIFPNTHKKLLLLAVPVKKTNR